MRSHISHLKFFIENEWIAHFFEKIAHCSFLDKNERFARKTDERIPSPGMIKLEQHVYICNSEGLLIFYFIFVECSKMCSMYKID